MRWYINLFVRIVQCIGILLETLWEAFIAVVVVVGFFIILVAIIEFLLSLF
jgi:hypothetical protein